ncbi:hypothetical protein G6O67_002556 [Ophiocordyceps sinensis]|uniref:NACHT domain-containing protein n=1 Tax=Ophiocordyceps sinensis TaxID=72228 RepID=A0A8H4V7L4_9HYPO|nr:hypothetical protein G6O67_002556 [Ophiocordyceps sinensis]
MSDPNNYTIGWISAIELEYAAAQEFLDDTHQGPRWVHKNDGNHYTLGRIGKHNVVMAVLPMGENGVAAATMAAKDMTHTFPNRTEEEDDPTVHYGLIASADTFMDDAEIRDILAEELDVMCFEMEAAGLMNNFPCLVIRGICDYSDAHWAKDWRGYAAIAAAAYARDVLHEVMGHQLEAEKGIGQLLEQIGQDLKDIQTATMSTKEEVQNLRTVLDSNKTTVLHRQCLRDLYVTDPRDDKKRIQDTKGGLVKDSYRWILAHGDFQRWRCDEQSRLFWVKGDPGKGKTMLLCGIIEELSSRKPKDREATPLLAYFFCQAADSRINSAMAVVRGLIYMLVLQQPSLVSHVQNEYDHKGKALFEDVNAWATLSNILTNMLQDQRAQGGYVLIDALDECIVDLQRLLNLIVDKSSTSRFKWLVSSRNWPNVEEHLDMTTRKVRLCLELNEESISTAVSIYIDHEVDRLARLKKYDDATRDAVRSSLCSGANNTFLWVSLVCRELADLKVKRWHTLKKLHEFPPGLDSLYERMLGQISGLDDVDVCKQILAVVSAVYRPLTLQELTSLVDMPDGISDYESLAEMTRLCGSFLTLRERTVYFVHQSAQEFLLHKSRADVFPCGIKHTHSAIFSRSLDVLSDALHTDLYGLRAPGFPIDDVKQPEPDPLAAAQYSCVYWVKHLCQGDSREVQVSVCHRAKILAFLRTHLLHWLEALSLTRGISHGALAISSLESEFEADTSDELGAFIHDAKRFILLNRSVIEKAPLQLYSSALIFTPGDSIVRRQFEKQVPGWIYRLPMVSKQWSSLLQTFEDHADRIYELVFSPDGKLLASADGRVIRVWDTETGAAVQTFTCGATSLAFTSDGQLLSLENRVCASVQIWDLATGKSKSCWERDDIVLPVMSPDGRLLADRGGTPEHNTVGLWDIKTRAVVKTLVGHSSRIDRLDFSPDSKRVVSTSHKDGTTRLWDAVTGATLQTVNTGYTEALGVSRNGLLMAWVYWDDAIKVWDTATTTGPRRLLHGQQGGGGSGPCLAMSPNGKLLAVTLHQDNLRTIRVLDAAIGTVQQTLKGHLTMIDSLAFSPDGKLVASGSADGIVRLWNAVRSRVQETPGDDSSSTRIFHMALSPDGRTVALDREANTMRILTAAATTIELWDMSKGVLLQTLEGHSKTIQAVVFPPETGRLLSTSEDATRLWDLTTGTYLETLDPNLINAAAFSPDGKLVALASYDNSIGLWDAAATTILRVLNGHSTLSGTLEFSPNSQLLASAPSRESGGTIKLWDPAMGTALQALKGHSKLIHHMVFSPDSKTLASASEDRTVRLWDTATGAALRVLQHSKPVQAVAFSPDGTLIASEESNVAMISRPWHSHPTAS